MKKLIFIATILSLLLIFTFSVFATTSATSSNTFEFNHVWSINPLGTLLGFGTVNYNSKAEALNTSISPLGIPIFSENFMFLQPLKLDAVNSYWDTVTILGFLPIELGIGAQYIMQSGFFVGGDLDLSILLMPWRNLYVMPWGNLYVMPWGNLYVGIYY